MKILTADQIRALDAYTIANEPVASIDLMERAALAFVNWFTAKFSDADRPVCIAVGPGNNGGDGLAVARMLHQRFYAVHLYRCHIGTSVSGDFQANWNRLPEWDPIPVTHVREGDALPEFPAGAVLIDAIFGSGLNRPVAGYWGELIHHINTAPLTRVAIDVPSGLFTDAPSEGACIEAHHTFSFELPKLAFFFGENHQRVGEWHTGSIGLDADFIGRSETPFFFLDRAMVQPMLRSRRKYDHKGTFGHALLLMGSYGKVGAAILASKACLRCGAGLVTAHVPHCGYWPLQTAVPEAMVSGDPGEYFIAALPDLQPYSAIGAGCGWGQEPATVEVLKKLIEACSKPLVLDADALNLLAKDRDLLYRLPEGCILTPHPKEFERLFGATANGFERNALQRDMAQTLNAVIVLKGAHTCVAAPDGACYFNATGNPGMATGGSGDVLTGIITGLLAQGYSPLEAALLGVYLHGLAGDLAAQAHGYEALVAGDLADFLGKAFIEVGNHKP